MPPAWRQVGLGDGDTAGQDLAEVPAGVEPFAGRERDARWTPPGCAGGAECSGSTGSSTNSGCSGSSRGSSRRGMAVETRPWKSTAMSRSSPSTSRTAATRSTTSAVRAGVSIGASSAGGVHLHGGEARLHLLLGGSATSLGAVAADPGVHPDAVAHRAAEQLVHRGAAGLAGDVPQRLVDAGDGAGEDRAAAVEAALGEHLPVVLDAQRVPADEEVGQFVDGGAHGVGAALDHGLAPAGDALVGGDAQEQPARRHQERLKSGYLQGISFGSVSVADVVVVVPRPYGRQVVGRLRQERLDGGHGGVRVARFDRVQQFLVHGYGVGEVLGAVHDPVADAQAGLDDDLHPAQQFVVRGVQQGAVEGQVGLDHRVARPSPPPPWRRAPAASRPGRRRCGGPRRAGLRRARRSRGPRRGLPGSRRSERCCPASAAGRCRAGSSRRGAGWSCRASAATRAGPWTPARASPRAPRSC